MRCIAWCFDLVYSSEKHFIHLNMINIKYLKVSDTIKYQICSHDLHLSTKYHLIIHSHANCQHHTSIKSLSLAVKP